MTSHLLRREVVFDWRWFRRRPDGQMGHHTAAVLNRDLALVVLKEDLVLIQLLDFAVNFPFWLISGMTFRWSVLRMICGSRLLPMDPPDTATERRMHLPHRRVAQLERPVDLLPRCGNWASGAGANRRLQDERIRGCAPSAGQYPGNFAAR